MTPTPAPSPRILWGQPGQGLCVLGGEVGEEVLRGLFSASEEPGSMCPESQVSVLLGRGGPLVLLPLCIFCIYVFIGCTESWLLLAGFPKLRRVGASL